MPGPPRLHFSVSITPPTPAPHIFRMLPAPVTDDTGLQVAKLVPATKRRQEGRWITRTVVDHSGQEQFVVRTRYLLKEAPRAVRYCIVLAVSLLRI